MSGVLLVSLLSLANGGNSAERHQAFGQGSPGVGRRGKEPGSDPWEETPLVPLIDSAHLFNKQTIAGGSPPRLFCMLG